MSSDQVLAIVNPLPQMLAHYVEEVEQTLDRVNIQHQHVKARRVEGKAGVGGKLIMLMNALTNAKRWRNGSHSAFVTWPSLGLLEAQIWGRKQNNFLVVHDPIPIRRQIGFDPISKRLVRAWQKGGPTIVSHSSDAFTVAHALLPRHAHVCIPHPILTAQTRAARKMGDTSVVVAGQYKPERDVKLLRELAPMLKAEGISAYIYGRGWPEIPGWTIDDRFLSEDELDTALASADLVLIPYQRYFQSGVAVRALELGTMSVSPRNSFALELLGASALVDDSMAATWMKTIVRVLTMDDGAKITFNRYQERVDREWSGLFSGASQ